MSSDEMTSQEPRENPRRERSRVPAGTGAAHACQAGERGLDFEAAFARGLEALAAADITTALRDLGGDPGAWKCELTTAGGETLAGGCGKGARSAARTGAVFEALEHHHSGLASVRAESVELRSAHAIAAEFPEDPALGALGDGPDKLVACRHYRAFDGSAPTAIPIHLTCVEYPTEDARELRLTLGDAYDYSSVLRYSVNSGCAAGSSATEASVHALNEIIERDAWSMLLIRAFLTPYHRLTLFDRDSLPMDLVTLLTRAEERAGGRRVELIDMTTDLGVPSVMAYVAPEAGGAVRFFGCGTSLSRRHAIIRALTELIQTSAVESVLGEQVHDREGLRRYPPFLAASQMDFGSGLRTAATVAFVDTRAPERPAGHLDRLIDILSEHGFRSYVRELFVAANGVAVVSAVVPGLERFMIVHLGSMVVPGPRGMAAIREPAESVDPVDTDRQRA